MNNYADLPLDMFFIILWFEKFPGTIGNILLRDIFCRKFETCMINLLRGWMNIYYLIHKWKLYHFHFFMVLLKKFHKILVNINDIFVAYTIIFFYIIPLWVVSQTQFNQNESNMLKQKTIKSFLLCITENT